MRARASAAVSAPHARRAGERTRRLLACLGDPSRFALAQALLPGERCVTELATLVGLSQSCTTRHLQALAREGLIRSRRDGKRVLCRLAHDEATAAVLALVGNPAPAREGAPAPRRPAPRRPRLELPGPIPPADDFGAHAGAADGPMSEPQLDSARDRESVESAPRRAPVPDIDDYLL
jgi:DNA-binding transcriptional ArsR family regulator